MVLSSGKNQLKIIYFDSEEIRLDNQLEEKERASLETNQIQDDIDI